MNIRLVFETLGHLKLKQILYQCLARVSKPKIKYLEASLPILPIKIENPILKYSCLNGNDFNFLNIFDSFTSWNQTEHGMLWAYNLNYMDWLDQEEGSMEDRVKWIDKFVDELPQNRVGLDPYPIALRSINWVKFFCKYPDCATKERVDSLYSQVLLLNKKLEYRLLGNHLLEDAYALFIASIYFQDKKLYKKASKLLKEQLQEQILPDGAHYEQSPMYHCILLDRLLDSLNYSLSTEDADFTNYLERIAVQMLGHLESLVWKDGSIPLLNDAAYGIASTAEQIFDYAKRLGIKWDVIPLKECGYRKLQIDHLEAIVDVGNITATYQPGHTHADTFNYELRIDGLPFVVDTGISTYNKTERRQLERSTVAHNAVSVNGKNSSEVWGGFRVGRRCHTKITVDSIHQIEAYHNGFGKKCWRKFSMNDKGFVVEDRYDGEAVSYLHLAEGADIKRVTIDGAQMVDVKPWEYSTTYNQFHKGKVMEIRFKGQLRYTIR